MKAVWLLRDKHAWLRDGAAYATTWFFSRADAVRFRSANPALAGMVPVRYVLAPAPCRHEPAEPDQAMTPCTKCGVLYAQPKLAAKALRAFKRSLAAPKRRRATR